MAHMNTFTSTGAPTMASPTNSSNSGHTNMKNDNTTSQQSRPSGLTSNDDEQDGSAGTDGSANEGQASAEDDADAVALSGVAKLTMEPTEHLAGESPSDALQDDDMMFLDDVDMMDSTPGSEGADDLSAKDFEIDDDYTGLEAISDDERSGEEIEKDVLKAAETDLRQEYLEQEASMARQQESDWFAEELNEAGYRSRNFSIGSDEDDPFGLSAPLNLNEDPFQGAQLFDSQWQGLMDDAELNLWRMPHSDRPREDSFNSTDRPKRVRFAEGAPLSRTSSRSSSGSSDDEDDNNNQYPDIFMDQDDPKIQQLLAQDRGDADMNNYGSDAGSVYDFEDDADRFAFEMDEESDSSEFDSDSELSDDSEDDGGYETEEEDPEEAKAKMQEVCKMSRAPVTAASAPTTPTQSKRTPAPLGRSNSVTNGSAIKSNKNKKGPREGTFECDPTKATVVSDSTGKKTVLYMPTQPSAQNKAFWERAKSAASSRNNSPRGSMSITLPGRGGKDEQQPRPFTAQSTLSTMFDGNFDFMQQSDVSPPPPPRTAPLSSYAPSQSAFTTPAPTDAGSDADEDYPDFNMLVDLNQDSDDDYPDDWSAAVTSPHEPTFLSRGMVGSFRLNQHRAKQESSLASHPDSRASTSEVNALQSGRRGAGNAPITPARKRRLSWDLNRTNSGIRKPATPAIGSPLSARRPRSRGQSLSGRLDQTLSPGYSLKQQ